MWIAIVTAIVVALALDLYARNAASSCDSCGRKLQDVFGKLAFWQERVHRAKSIFANLVKKPEEKALCVGCVESRRALRQIESLQQRAAKFRMTVRNAEAKVAGTIQAEALKIARASKDLDLGNGEPE